MRKNMLKKFLAIVGCAGVITAMNVGIGHATTKSDAAASGSVVIPVEITEDVPLSFGKFIASSAATLILDQSDSYGTVSGITTITGPKSGVFTIKGTADEHYNVTLPSAPVTLTNATSDTMELSGFTADALTGTFTGNNQTLKVGATLAVSVGQASGTYTGTYSIAVDYQ